MGTLRGWEVYRGKRSLEHYGGPPVETEVVLYYWGYGACNDISGRLGPY